MEVKTENFFSDVSTQKYLKETFDQNIFEKIPFMFVLQKQ